MTNNKFLTALPAAFLAALLLLSGCGRGREEAGRSLTVSLPPQAWLLERIAGPQWRVDVLLPSGADPESYDPRPSDMRRLEQSDAWFQLGTFTFEHTLAGRSRRAVDLSRAVALLHEEHGHEGHDDHGHEEGCEHVHGEFDPHTWLSPANMRAMALAMGDSLASLDPAGADGYRRRAQAVAATVDSVGAVAAERLAPRRGTTFLVWHPSLGYFAEEYGLRQVSLVGAEHKEMSARGMADRLDRATASGARVMVLQEGAEKSRAAFAPEGVATVTLNLMGRDWPALIDSLSKALSQ